MSPWIRLSQHLSRLALLCLGVLSLHATALAAWPRQTVTLIVPFAEDSVPHTLARTIAAPLSAALGQPVRIENLPGNAGKTGMRTASQAPADGYTLVYVTNGPLVSASVLYGEALGYDPFKDFTPITLVATSPNLLVVSAGSGITSVAELVQQALRKPGQLNYGATSPGSANHLAMELLKQQAGIDMVQIPFASYSLVLDALTAGSIQASFMVPAAAMPEVQRGNMRALALSCQAQMTEFPGLPTISDNGYEGFEAVSWHAIMAPAGTPPAIVARLNHELRLVLSSPDVDRRMREIYFTPTPTTPDGVTERMKDEQTRWANIVQNSRKTQ